MLISSAKLVKQIESGIHHKVRTRTRLIDFVHHQNRTESQSQSFLGHKTGLGHRPLLCIDQQHHTVDHRQSALYFTAEIRVSWGVDDVDVGAFPTHRTVFGQDGDATFTLNSVVVHHGVHYFFVLGKGTGLAQKLVDHGSFTVVHVRDDGDIANLFTHTSLSKMV